MKKIIITATILVLLFSGYYFFFIKTENKAKSISSEDILIGFSMGTLQEERWQRDRFEFLKKADELGVVVDLQASDNNTEKQISQIEKMILKGVDVLVVAPYDADSLSSVIEAARKANIKVLSYDRLMTKTHADLYLSFDNEKVGEYEAQAVIDALKDKFTQGKKLKLAYVGGSLTDNNAVLLKKGSFKILQPLIDSGKIEIVFDKFTPNWNPENAYSNFKNYLKSSVEIDGVVAANDGTAFGVIRALQEFKLSGLVPVSGQDAELSALRRIVEGVQIATVYKPIPLLASTAVELAVKLAKGERIDTNQTVNNGQTDIPAVLLSATLVTKSNIENTVIKDGYYNYNDIYIK